MQTLPLKDVINAINEAIREYENNYSRRASNRAQNILEIRDICGKATDTTVLLDNLEAYFCSDKYHTGLRDKSALEDLIAKKLTNIGCVKDGLNTFGYCSPNTEVNALPNGAVDGTRTLNYKLEDYVNYFLDRYEEEYGPISEFRQKNIEDIRKFLTNPSSAAKDIHEYINGHNFTHSFNSSLKRYMETALNYASTQDKSRQLATRTWKAKDAYSIKEPAEKVMIFLHGWHDSIESANKLAKQAVAEGFKVYAYDHRGHGKDADRDKKFGIPTDLLRIDFRKFLAKVQDENPNAEIALVGHSMGGALLTTENKLINQNANVKSVALITPAIMSGLGKMLDPAKVFFRNMHDDVRQEQQKSTRFGGKGVSLFGLLNLMGKAANSLAKLVTAPEANKKWSIFVGHKDASVNIREFTSLPNQQNIKFYPRGDHGLHFFPKINSDILTSIKERLGVIKKEGSQQPSNEPIVFKT